tara:strand:- start:29 stop:760 length:732 start_codon:yes stop_codon:yes gene_type:complete
MENEILHGDCLNLLKDLDDNSMNMILTDLPYFGIVNDEWDNQWKSENDYFNWLEMLVIEYNRILKNNSNIFLFSGRQYNRHLNLILDKYFIEKRIIIWARKRMYNSTRGNALSSGYEPISFYSKGDNSIFNKIKVSPTREDLKKRYEKHSYLKNGIILSDVWDDIPALPYNSKEKLNHSSQKPLKLIERIIKIGSNENDIILDSCAGVLTTAKACKNLNRKYICIEIDNNFIKQGKGRLNEII